MIEAGSKVNWAALEAGVVDKIFFYYAPKILGGMQSLPVAGGVGRRRRADAIRFRDVSPAPRSPPDEFAVEAWWSRSLSMFTGIIEELGAVEALEPRAGGARLRVRCRTVLEDAAEGASIAVNGVCLTAVEPAARTPSAADVAPETLRRSNLGDLRPGLAREPGAAAVAAGTA